MIISEYCFLFSFNCCHKYYIGCLQDRVVKIIASDIQASTTSSVHLSSVHLVLKDMLWSNYWNKESLYTKCLQPTCRVVKKSIRLIFDMGNWHGKTNEPLVGQYHRMQKQQETIKLKTLKMFQEQSTMVTFYTSRIKYTGRK